MQNTSTAAPEKISQPDQDLNAKILSLSVDEGRGVESSAASTAIEWEDITGDGGVLKYLIRTGTGDQHGASGDKVSVHYVGTLKDSGEEFDSSRKTNYPYKFVLGGGTVISGWERAVPSMLVGETARFEIRSDYAYGDAGSAPDIGPGATLHFEIELLALNAEGNQAAALRATDEKDRLAKLRAEREAAAQAKAQAKEEREARKAAAQAKLQSKLQAKGSKGKGGGKKKK
mmetsp:Transcript_6642/g.9199  ORF Transcript_6642/g.9199 Transcript_6642/m.9199 type:complete len:230 (-) Transcript_6642:351-1040(-)